MDDDIDRAIGTLTSALESQTEAINGLSLAISKQRRTGRLVAFLVALNLVGVAGAGITIVQNNQAATERARVAVEQRTQQLEILKQLQAK